MRRAFVDINFQLGDSAVFTFIKNDLITIKINHDGISLPIIISYRDT